MYKSSFENELYNRELTNYGYNDEGLGDMWNNLGKGGRDNPYGRAQVRHNTDYELAMAKQQNALADLEDWYQEELTKIKRGLKSKYRIKSALDTEFNNRKTAIELDMKIDIAKADYKRDKSINENTTTWDKIKYWGGKAAQIGIVAGAAYGADRALADKDGNSTLTGNILSTSIALQGGSTIKSRY